MHIAGLFYGVGYLRKRHHQNVYDSQTFPGKIHSLVDSTISKYYQPIKKNAIFLPEIIIQMNVVFLVSLKYIYANIWHIVDNSKSSFALLI